MQPCYCGASALAAVRRRKPDLILLDLGMQPMDGFTVLAKLRDCRQWENIPVVALSGHSSDSHRRRARLAGVVHFLEKPVEPKLIKSLLDTIIGVPASGRCRDAVEPATTIVRVLSHVEAI